MNVDQLLRAGKVPTDLSPWNSGDMNAWTMEGNTYLSHVCLAGLHMVHDEHEDNVHGGYTVMEDSERELRRHLHAVHHATGHVLKTGLGMGCFVRMCLTKPDVKHIDVIEIDPGIADHFGAQFNGDPRVTIHVADAFEFPLDPYCHRYWDFAWHDIYCEGNQGLQKLHGRLILRYAKHCRRQGAWGDLPRWFRRALRKQGVI